MTTILGILLFSSLLAAATIGRVFFFVRGAAAHGWVVERSFAGFVLVRSAPETLSPWVTLPFFAGERRAGQRWCVRVEGELPGVPDGGLSIFRPGRGPNVRATSPQRKVKALEPGGAVARARDEDVARSVARDADAVAALERVFAADSHVVEIACTRTGVEVRARRDRWSFAELDAVCARAVEVAEAFEAPA